MIQSLGDGTIDVSVALTEALIAGIASALSWLRERAHVDRGQ